MSPIISAVLLAGASFPRDRMSPHVHGEEREN